MFQVLAANDTEVSNRPDFITNFCATNEMYLSKPLDLLRIPIIFLLQLPFGQSVCEFRVAGEMYLDSHFRS
jgi:hypothetical protein